MTALWARNKFGWDRPGSTMTFSLPNAAGDLGPENKIIIEMVPAPKHVEKTAPKLIEGVAKRDG